MASRKPPASTNCQQVLALAKRVEEIEKLLMTRSEVTPTDCTTPLMVDIAPFLKVLKKKPSPLLEALYPPKEDDSTHYNLDELKITVHCSGYWPEKANWHGIYLGGCDEDNNRRRAFTIPACLMNNLPFFTPQGLQNSDEHYIQRATALNNCSCAIIDFTWDEMCLNYTAGIDLRQRRKEYYSFLRDLVEEPAFSAIDGLREFTSFEGDKGLAHDMVNLRANYDYSNDKRARVSVIDRIITYKTMKAKEKDVKSDIAIIMRICYGMLLLCDMNTQTFMDEVMPSWKELLGEFMALCTTISVISQIHNDDDDKSDSDIHNSACIDLVHFIKTVVQSRPYLNF